MRRHCFEKSSCVVNYQNGILPPLFIGLDLKSLTNNLQLPLLHEATLFLWFINHVHLYNSSSSLIIVSGGAGSMCCSLNCGALYFVSKSLLNILCIIHPSGSSSWNAPRLISFEILKSLYFFWSSFFKGWFE